MTVCRTTVTIASSVFVTFGDILSDNIVAFDRIFDNAKFEKILVLNKSKSSSTTPPVAATTTPPLRVSQGSTRAEDDSILFVVNSAIEKIPMQVKLVVDVQEICLKLFDDDLHGVVEMKAHQLTVSSTIGVPTNQVSSTHPPKAYLKKNTPTVLSIDGSLLSVEIRDIRESTVSTVRNNIYDTNENVATASNSFQSKISSEMNVEKGWYDPTKLLTSDLSEQPHQYEDFPEGAMKSDPFIQFNMAMAYDTRSDLEVVNTLGVSASPYRVSLDVFSNPVSLHLSPDPILTAISTGLALVPSIEYLHLSVDQCVVIMLSSPLTRAISTDVRGVEDTGWDDKTTCVEDLPRKEPTVQVGIEVPYLLGGFVSLIVMSFHISEINVWLLEDILQSSDDGRFGDGCRFKLGHATSRISLDLATLTIPCEPCTSFRDQLALMKYVTGNNTSFSATVPSHVLLFELALSGIELQYVRCLNPYSLQTQTNLESAVGELWRIKDKSQVLCCELILNPLSTTIHYQCFALSIPRNGAIMNTGNDTSPSSSKIDKYGVRLLKLSHDMSLSASSMSMNTPLLTLLDIGKVVKRFSTLSMSFNIPKDATHSRDKQTSYSREEHIVQTQLIKDSQPSSSTAFKYGKSVILPFIIEDGDIAALVCMSEVDVSICLNSSQVTLHIVCLILCVCVCVEIYSCHLSPAFFSHARFIS